MKEHLIYLDSYVLQQDMRIRMPKCILENTNAIKGKTKFGIYLDSKTNCLVLKPEPQDEENTKCDL